MRAGRATERTRGSRVLLLEAGSEYARVLSVPLAGLRQTVAFSWKYFTVQQRGLSRRRISFPFGKVLGGSSSTNGMMFYRGARASYDRWGELGNAGWSFSDLLPYFRKSETWEHGASEFHGDSGPVHVSTPRHRAPFSESFRGGVSRTGHPVHRGFQRSTRRGDRLLCGHATSWPPGERSVGVSCARPASRRSSRRDRRHRAQVAHRRLEGGCR